VVACLRRPFGPFVVLLPIAARATAQLQATEVSQMGSTNHPARGSGHLSRHERQRLARADTFSRRSAVMSAPALPVQLTTEDVVLIDRLIRRDRTAVSTALLATAGIGASEGARRAVLARMGAASRAVAQGAISPGRAEQVAIHAKRAVCWTGCRPS
jgi:hypothetical protein